MPHCRFENTAADLEDCLQNINDDLSDNSHEMGGRRRLVRLCKRIADQHDPEEWDVDEAAAVEEDQ